MNVAGKVGGLLWPQQAVFVTQLEVEGAQIRQVEPLDVIAEGPSLRARGPEAIARAAQGDFAIEWARQDLVDREGACREDSAGATKLGRLCADRAGQAETND